MCRASSLAFFFAIFAVLFLPTEILTFYKRSQINFQATIQLLAFWLAVVPVLPISVAILWKKNKVIDALDYLQQVVVESKRISFIEFSGCVGVFRLSPTNATWLGCCKDPDIQPFLIRILIDLAIFLPGSNLSSQLLANYVPIDAKYTRVTTRIVKYIALGILGQYVISATFPIAYAIFEYPRPDQWTLPVPYR